MTESTNKLFTLPKMNEILDMMAGYGFPMVVATYLLVRIDKRLANLELTIEKLCNILQNKIN